MKAKGGWDAWAKAARMSSYFKIKKVITGPETSQTIVAEQWIDGLRRTRETEQVRERTVSRKGISFKSYTRTEIHDGDKVLRYPPQAPGMAELLLRAQFKKIVDHILFVQLVAPMLKWSDAYTVTIEREEKVGKRDALTIRVKKKDLPDVLLSFDRTTWLLLKSEAKIPFLWFEPVKHQTLFSDYKEFLGVQFPTKVVWQTGETKGEVVYQELRRLEKVDDSLFQAPGKKPAK
jgi:hypothetical protein